MMKNNNFTPFNCTHSLPELLAPAGSFECLKAAVQNGADAVYLGLKNGSARMGAENFTLEQLFEATQYAHTYGVKVYLALNTLFTDKEIDLAYENAKKAVELGIDAIILQDMGLAHKIFKNRNDFPCEIHASTQMSIFNENGIHFLEEMGFDRCITARELSINEIANLCSSSKMQIEVFCHGALCMSVSGQCLLSSFIGGRSGNKGTCAQPCRMKYALQKENTSNGEISTSVPAYRLSPADLAALPYLKELIEAGVHSLKIEGRLKSPAYVAAVTKSYREALDALYENQEPYIDINMKNMQLLFARGELSAGYLNGKLPFKDITFRTSGRVGLHIGASNKPITKLPPPKNLPSNLTRFKVVCTLYDNASLQAGDGITVYDAQDDYSIVCGGTINSISRLPNSAETEIILVGRINLISKSNTKSTNIPNKKYIISLTDDCSLREELDKITNSENKKVSINIYFYGHIGEPPILTMYDENSNSISFKGDKIISKAFKTPTSEDDIKKQLSKLGDTLFVSNDIAIDINDDIFIPVSYLNELRRQCVELLINKRKNKKLCYSNSISNITPIESRNINGGISLFFYKTESFLNHKYDNIPDIISSYSNESRTYYIPLSAFYSSNTNSNMFDCLCEKISQLKNNHSCSFIAYFNILPFGKAYQSTNKELPLIISRFLGKELDGFMLENPGDIFTLKNAMNEASKNYDWKFLSPVICADYSFNIANSNALSVQSLFGINRSTISPENFIDFDFANENINCEMIVGGKLILMRSRHCFIDEGTCSGQKSKCLSGNFSLVDSQKCTYPILPQKEDCCSILLSHKDISISLNDIKKIRTHYPKITLRINVL